MGRGDRRRRPVGRDPVRRHPLRAGPLAARPRRRRGSDHRSRPDLVRRLPGGGARVRARRRGAAPRRQAVQRADGGAHPHPDRLRPGPGGRRPEAHPHRLAARARPATSPPRSCTATTPPPPPTSTPGRRRWRTPAPAGRRSDAVRRWRSWTGCAAASTTSTACRRSCAASSRPPSTPSPRVARASTTCSAGCARPPPGCRPSRRSRTPTRCRWRSPPRPRRTTPPTSCTARPSSTTGTPSRPPGP